MLTAGPIRKSRVFCMADKGMMLVLWSGGLDSTLALYRTLTGDGREDGAWSTSIDSKGRKDYAHRTLAIQTDQVIGQRWMLRARTRIGKLLRSHKFEFGESTTIITSEAKLGGRGLQTGDKPWSIQAPLWIAVASLFASKGEDVVCSWIMDDGLERLDRLKAAFNALHSASGKHGQLLTPLSGHTKSDVLFELRAAHVKGLEEASWYCEGGYTAVAKRRFKAGKPCGECQKCDEVTAAKFRLKNFARYEDIHGKAKP